MNGNNILEVRRLRKKYRGFTLDDIDLDLPFSGVTGIIGPNGAGKTTTIKLIMNMIVPDRGSITVFGRPHDQDEKFIKNRIGYVGEEQPFYDFHSAVWTGRFVSHFFEKWDAALYARYLDAFQLPPRKRIKSFSKGMRVKLALAVALSHDPELVILDEPTAGLDPVVRRDILERLREIASDKERAVLISSHITDDLERIADNLVYMINGRIVLFSDKDSLLAEWKRVRYTPDALDEDTISALTVEEKGLFGSSGITREYSRLKPRLAKALTQGHVKIENMGLDDILIQLAGE